MSITSSQLQYKKYTTSYPMYKYSKLQPQSGINLLSVNSGGDQIIFETPPNQAYNLARSYLSYVWTFRDSSATLQMPDAKFLWVPVDCLSHFRQIQFLSKGNVIPADISDLGNYTQMVWKLETKYDEFINYDTFSSPNVKAATAGLGYSQMLRPSWKTDQTTSYRAIQSSNNTHNSFGSSLPISEPQYFIQSATSNHAGQADMVLNIQLPLNRIVNSIFEIDKDLLFDEVMQIRFVTNGTNKMAFIADTATDPSTGVAFTGTVSLSNLALYLAVEKNLEIENQLRAEKNSATGLKVLIPFVYQAKLPLPQSTSHNLTVRINPSHGNRLRKIYWAPFDSTETGFTVYDHCNVENDDIDSKIQYFHTEINQTRQQQFDVDCFSGLDYMLMKDKLKDTLYLNKNIYDYNWVWCDDFTNHRSLNECDSAIISTTDDKTGKHAEAFINDQNISQGLDLQAMGEIKWDLQATLPSVGTALTHYVYFVTEKILTITSRGIFLDNNNATGVI